MNLHQLIDQSYQTLLEKMDDTRLVLLHPRSRYRSMVIAKLINSPDFKVFYYAMGPDDINLHAFISSLSHDLANQHVTFGRHINLLPKEVYEYPEQHFDQVLETFTTDLSEITTDPFVLILDEYDRSDRSDDVQRFVERLSGAIPANCRIVLNSRTLPRLPWIPMIADHRALIIEDNQLITDDFYELGKHEHNNLEIYALGPGFVLSEGEPVDNWEGHLPRLLFFFTLDRPIVTRSEICQAFWPDLDIDQAVNVFHVTKRRLHKALDSDVLVHDDGYYHISYDMNVSYDLNDFASALVQARHVTDLDNRIEALQRAIETYRGPFLQGHDDPWIEERRAEFQAGYLEALTDLAAIWKERGDTEQALTLLQKGIEENPPREDLHRQIMELYVDLGRRGEAVEHYQKLAEALAESEEEPETETTELYKQIKA